MQLQRCSMEQQQQYIGITEASKILGVSFSTVKNWLAAGQLTGQMVAGRRVVTRESVEAKRNQKGAAQ